MYKRSIWNEEDWDIHRSGYSHKSHGSTSESISKYKNEHYHGKKDKEGIYNPNEDYKKSEEEEKKNKEEDVKETIANKVEQEEKYRKNEEDEGNVFTLAAKELSQDHLNAGQKSIPSKKKHLKTIEDAINKAVKEEKEVIIMDR